MNLAPQEKKILPKYGVYACRVLVDGVWYGGVGNAGVKPTVAQEKRRLFEVYVYGYEGDAYGKTATVQILMSSVQSIKLSKRYRCVISSVKGI